MRLKTGASEPAAAADVFELLGNETRVRIVAALYGQWQAAPGQPCLTFSELCERVGVADTGQFNYHLRRLRDVLIDKREAGYALTPLGVCLGQLIAAESPAPMRICSSS